jgi:hypothetical protein
MEMDSDESEHNEFENLQKNKINPGRSKFNELYEIISKKNSVFGVCKLCDKRGMKEDIFITMVIIYLKPWLSQILTT